MMFRYKPLVLALALGAGLANPCWAGIDSADWQQLLSAPRLDEARLASLYRQTSVSSPGLKGAEQQLTALAQQQPALLARAWVVKGYLAWQDGNRAQAQAAADAAVKAGGQIEAWLLKARLLDSQGQATEALGWYQKALAKSALETDRQQLRLTMAIIASDKGPAPLIELAKSGQFSGAPSVMALLGYPKSALAHHLGVNGFAKAVQVADWAIAAKHYRQAQTLAWQAYQQATDIADQRYALAVLVEAYRKAGHLEGAISFLNHQPRQLPTEQVKLDVLLELGRFDEAEQLARRAPEPAFSQQLVTVLEMAGRYQDLAGEYQRLIKAEPKEARWYQGLASLYLAQGDPQKATDTYTKLVGGQQGNTPLLIQTAQLMAGQGLDDQALALVKELGSGEALTAVQLFMIGNDLDHGQDEKAITLLRLLDNALAANDTRRLTLADGFERLQQPARALAILDNLEKAGVALGYDQQVHMAKLAMTAEGARPALARWQALWRQASLPARKHYLEKQLIGAATEAGELKGLIATLQRAVDANKARPDELDLLVSIYLEQNQRPQALATAQRFASQQGEGAAALQRLSALYLRLDDHRAYQQTLEAQIKANPGQAALYLRQLILSTLKYDLAELSPKDRLAKIDPLLRRLQGLATGDAQSFEFAAGVYARAGLEQQAVRCYRQALAQDPGRSDDLLQMTELMKNSGDVGEAVTLLQLAVMDAADDNRFAAAIDGLVNTVATDDPALPAPRSALLSWAKRQVLARIAQKGADFYLYSLLADLAQEDADFTLVSRTYQNALALSDQQRPQVLRQLIALASGGADSSENGGPVLIDDASKVTFGRRLIALKREYPAELYSSLANSLLKSGDLLGAEQAFSMMSDISGLINVDEIKGDSFDDAGFIDKALSDYSRALLQDQDNIALALKTARLLEQKGQSQRASHWYWHALEQLMQRQPLQRSSVQGGETLEFNRFAPSLSEGFLLNWQPDQPGYDKALLAMISATLEATRARAGHITYAHALRLQLLVDLGFRMAQKSPGLWTQIEAQVQRDFAQDPSYLAMIDDLAITAGKAAKSSLPYQPLKALSQQADIEHNANLSLAIAIDRQDKASLGKLTVAALENEQQRHQPGAAGQAGQPYVYDTLYPLVLETQAHLPEESFRQWILAPVQRSAHFDDLLFDILRTVPKRYLELERVAGRPLLGNATIIDMLVNDGGRPLSFSRYYRAQMTLDSFLRQRLTLDEQLSLYGKLIAKSADGNGRSGLLDGLRGHLLTVPLNEGQRQQLSRALKQDITEQAGEGALGQPLAQLLVLNAAKDSRALLEKVAAGFAKRQPKAAQLPVFLNAWFRGDKDVAYQALLQLAEQLPPFEQDKLYSAVPPERYFKDQQQRHIERFMADSAPSKRDIDLFYKQFVLRGETQGQQQIAFYQKLLTLEPGNQGFVAGLLKRYWQLGRVADFNRQLGQYQQAHPDDLDARTLLFMALKASGEDQQAKAVATTAMGTKAWQQALVNKIAAQSASTGEGLGSLYRLLYEPFARKTSMLPDLGPSLQPLPDADLSDLAKAYATSPGGGIHLLRRLWRDSLPVWGGSSRPTVMRGELLNEAFDLYGKPLPAPSKPGSLAWALGERQDSPALLAQMAKDPGVSDELQAYIGAVPMQARPWMLPFYQLLAEGLVAQGRSEARLAPLQAELEKGQLDTDGLQMLVSLYRAEHKALSEPQAKALLENLNRIPVLAPRQRLLLSELLARSGQEPVAGQLLLSAALQQRFMQPQMLSQWYDRGQAGVSLQELVASLASWPDKAQAAKSYRTLIDWVGDSVADSASGKIEPMLDSFVLASAPSVTDAPAALVADIRPSALDSQGPQRLLFDAQIALGKQQYQVAIDGIVASLRYHKSSGYDRDAEAFAYFLYGSNGLQPTAMATLLAAADRLFPLANGQQLLPWLDSLTQHLEEAYGQRQIKEGPYGQLLLVLAQRYQQLGEHERASQCLDKLGGMSLPPEQQKALERLRGH